MLLVKPDYNGNRHAGEYVAKYRSTALMHVRGISSWNRKYLMLRLDSKDGPFMAYGLKSVQEGNNKFTQFHLRVGSPDLECHF